MTAEPSSDIPPNPPSRQLMRDLSTILLVDDEESVQRLLAYPLERDGFRVLPAHDGEEALLRFEEESVDLVVLDIMLPKLDGLEVCKRIRAESMVPIIMLTARDDEFDKVLGLELGADDYITKPFSIREFRSRVRALLRRAAAPRLESREAESIEAGDLRLHGARRGLPLPRPVIRLRSVGTRLSLALLVIVAAGLAFVYVIVVPPLEDRLVDDRLDELERTAEPVALELRQPLVDEDDVLESAAAGTNARVLMLQRLGRDVLAVVEDSGQGQDPSPYQNSPVVLRALEARETVRDTTERGGEEFAEVATPIFADDETRALLLSSPLRDQLETVDLVERRLLIAGVLALLGAVLVGYGGGRVFSPPLPPAGEARERGRA